MDFVIKYLCVFAVGGFLCMIAQILIDKTKLTSARILVLYVVTGVFLTAIGVYKYIVKLEASAPRSRLPVLAFLYATAFLKLWINTASEEFLPEDWQMSRRES